MGCETCEKNVDWRMGDKVDTGYPLDCHDYYSTCGANNNTCDELKDGWQLWFLWASSATAWAAHIDLWKRIRYWTLEVNKKHIDLWKKIFKPVVPYYYILLPTSPPNDQEDLQISTLTQQSPQYLQTWGRLPEKRTLRAKIYKTDGGRVNLFSYIFFFSPKW